MRRCDWPKTELDVLYHDQEWGVPVREDGKLFEFLILEGAQAGLSWSTILKRRESYRAALYGFDVDRLARLTARDEARLLQDPGLIRNRLKIASLRLNALAFQEVARESGSFSSYLWSFVEDRPMVNRPRSMADIPSHSPESDRLSKDLKKRGFKFVGTTICYALMQAVGLVNDHLVTCFRHSEVQAIHPPAP